MIGLVFSQTLILIVGDVCSYRLRFTCCCYRHRLPLLPALLYHYRLPAACQQRTFYNLYLVIRVWLLPLNDQCLRVTVDLVDSLCRITWLVRSVLDGSGFLLNSHRAWQPSPCLTKRRLAANLRRIAVLFLPCAAAAAGAPNALLPLLQRCLARCLPWLRTFCLLATTHATP